MFRNSRIRKIRLVFRLQQGTTKSRRRDAMPRWDKDFVYAGSLSRTTSGTSVLRRPNGGDDEWLERKLKNARSYSTGCLTAKEKEDLHKKLASAGRDVDRGYVSPATYQNYVDVLLNKPHRRCRPKWQPPKPGKVTGPPHFDHTKLAKKNSEAESTWQSRVKARSKRERARTQAWVQRMEQQRCCVEPEDDFDTECSSSSSRSVVVSEVPATVPEVAVRDLARQYGAIDHVEKLRGTELQGTSAFLIQYRSSRDAARAGAFKTVTLTSQVRVGPLPRDCDGPGLRRLLSRWGRVVNIRFVRTKDGKNSEAIACFESSSAATRAIGCHPVDAVNELEVSGVPLDATEEHLRRAFGGLRQGVERIRLHFPSKGRAIVVFQSPAHAARCVGVRDIVITKEGGAQCALEKATAAAQKGAPPPWHTRMEVRPFASYDLHNYQFGRTPQSNREFVLRAAGTFRPETFPPGKGTIAGAAARYTTRRFPVTARVCSSTLDIVSQPLILPIAPS